MNSATDLEENSPLHVAAANGYIDSVKSLIASGANIEATNVLGWTPLMQATRYGHKTIVALLIHKKANIDTRNKFGLNALTLAVASGSIETVRLLIEHGADYNYELDPPNCQVSPLMIAALFSRNDVMRLFLDKGVNPNLAAPESDISALMVAASSGNLSMLKVLIERRAKPDFINAGKFSALDAAIICNNTEGIEYLKDCVQTLRKKDEKQCDIMEVIRHGDVSMLQDLLLNDSTKAKTKTPEGATPLMVAAAMNRISMAELLLRFGAEINAQDYENGWTPLMQAVYHRHTSMAKHLMDWGADVSIKAKQGYTVFDLANEVMDTDILKIFADKHIANMSAYSVLLGSDENAKGNNSESSGMSTLMQLLSKFMIKNIVYRGGTNVSETIPKPASNERRSSLTPLTVTYKSIYPGVSEENNGFYTNVFANAGKEEKDFFESMTPPSLRNTTESKSMNGNEMPARVTERFQGKCFSNELLVRKYKERQQAKLDSQKKCQPTHDLKVFHPHQVASPGYEAASHIPVPSHSRSGCHTGNSNLPAGGEANELPYSGYDTMSDLLEKFQLRSRANVFREEEIDSQAFMVLSPDDFRNLGFSGTQKINNIIKARQDFNANRKNQ